VHRAEIRYNFTFSSTFGAERVVDLKACGHSTFLRAVFVNDPRYDPRYHVGYLFWVMHNMAGEDARHGMNIVLSNNEKREILRTACVNAIVHDVCSPEEVEAWLQLWRLADNVIYGSGSSENVSKSLERIWKLFNSGQCQCGACRLSAAAARRFEGASTSL